MGETMNANQEELKRRVEKASANERVFIGDIHKYIKDIKFDDRVDGEYSWFGNKHEMCGCASVQPLQSANLIKTFKTLNGAKRNFIRRAISGCIEL